MPASDDDLVQHNESAEHSRAFCQNLVRVMADGARWGIPRSGVVFKLDKKNKRLIQVDGQPEHPDVLASRIVFRQIGWDVISQDEIDRDDTEEPENGNVR